MSEWVCNISSEMRESSDASKPIIFALHCHKTSIFPHWFKCVHGKNITELGNHRGAQLHKKDQIKTTVWAFILFISINGLKFPHNKTWTMFWRHDSKRPIDSLSMIHLLDSSPPWRFWNGCSTTKKWSN